MESGNGKARGPHDEIPSTQQAMECAFVFAPALANDDALVDVHGFYYENGLGDVVPGLANHFWTDAVDHESDHDDAVLCLLHWGYDSVDDDFLVRGYGYDYDCDGGCLKSDFGIVDEICAHFVGPHLHHDEIENGQRESEIANESDDDYGVQIDALHWHHRRTCDSQQAKEGGVDDQCAVEIFSPLK
jgi:hypothetical protein